MAEHTVETVHDQSGAIIGLRVDGTSYPVAHIAAALRGQVEDAALRQALGEAERQLAAIDEALALPRAADPVAYIHDLRSGRRVLPEPVVELIKVAQRVAWLTPDLVFVREFPADVADDLHAVIVRARAEAQRGLLARVGAASLCLPPEERGSEPPAPSIPRREAA